MSKPYNTIKFDYITKDENLTLALTNDLEQVANKYGLTLITFLDSLFVPYADDGNIIAYFDIKENKE